ncbi:nucleoside-diphosphate-sugar epimerase [Glaciihabitans tibetensis]|uniref:Nucleoside-diphosphate-sugar epimerase n=1 Tax=Glaciihabitans tibetensis TaxID=1266600 RepID=A0A2T0VIF1_9MICO|nr:SDR family oxidoreductase [Glaciihabitans tibetensis]PRY69992.1 nucleoside-diphosphate-sugar epimerase [Glaciihabitans tibetensis]
MTDASLRPDRHALVVGATGIAGSALRTQLIAEGWPVTTLSRSAVVEVEGERHLEADLRSPADLTRVLGAERFTHVFFTAWARQATEQENITVNAGMVRDLLAALDGTDLQHVALVTGLKHYLGPFESYGQGAMPDTPFHEEEERLDVDNFYYAQEDELWAAAERLDFTWSVHRSHTVIGHALGNAMNMGQTLAVQASLCRELGLPFVFPGSETQWNGLTDMTDATLLADHMIWASTAEGAGNEAYNVVNGDVFRWRWMWPRLAGYFGVTPEGFDSEPRLLETQMAGMDATWAAIAQDHGLAEADMSRVASWWHTDADLGRNIEVVADMGKSRVAGYTGFRRTEDAFIDLFDRLRSERVIPNW